MRVIQICLAALLLFTFRAAAQKGMPPVFEIRNDTGARIVLDTLHFQVLPNPAKEITLNDVLHESADEHFRTFQESMFSGAKGVAWFRFRIRNGTGRDHILAFTDPGKKNTLYIKNAFGKWEEITTGFDMPYSKRGGIKRSVIALFPIDKGEEITVYKRMQWSVSYEVKPSFAIYDPVQGGFEADDSSYLNALLSAALFGFMIFAAVFNFFFYYIVRERVYLIYTITLLFAAFYNISEYLFEFIFRDQPVIGRTTLVILMISTIILVLYTMRLFLNTKRIFPRWNKFLVYFPLIMVGLIFIAKYTVSPSNLDKASIFLTLFYLVGIIIMLIMYLIRKDANARLLTIALIPFFLAILASFWDMFYWVPILGLIWAISIISWSLFLRFRALMAENSRQAVEKEKLAREKEEERNALIAQQNEMLEHQVAERTSELSQSLTNLKQTQNQLIQSEKMASLGELTAGIAHEIQNPLNFVNNFSDVSIELLEELKEEADKGDLDEVKAIADDVMQNLGKIAHHGRRADGIVKGMLQHSRASSGQKEATDINALADEYFRLAYHGLRAKDKSFNAELVMQFDENLPKVNVIPQDVGRVLLNLFTNAFYATQEKSKLSQSQSPVYKPTVTVTTQQKDNSVKIIVKDNGTGIPDAIRDKILQPFFTTKPTGEGTGLGLSLSYDIIVKGHGGSIDIQSEEGEGSEFTITLPVAGS